MSQKFAAEKRAITLNDNPVIVAINYDLRATPTSGWFYRCFKANEPGITLVIDKSKRDKVDAVLAAVKDFAGAEAKFDQGGYLGSGMAFSEFGFGDLQSTKHCIDRAIWRDHDYRMVQASDDALPADKAARKQAKHDKEQAKLKVTETAQGVFVPFGQTDDPMAQAAAIVGALRRADIVSEADTTAIYKAFGLAPKHLAEPSQAAAVAR